MGKWIQRRWLEFRWGWMYIAYIISSINFITITYYLLIQDLGLAVPLWLYASLVAVLLPIFTVSVGHFYHKRYQLHTDILVMYEPLVREIERIVRRELRVFSRDTKCDKCGVVITPFDSYLWVGEKCFHLTCMRD